MKTKKRRLLDDKGRKLDATPIAVPQDHPQVKRYPLSHRYAKAFYLSLSTGSIEAFTPLRLNDFFIINDGTKTSAVSRAVVESWWPLPDKDDDGIT